MNIKWVFHYQNFRRLILFVTQSRSFYAAVEMIFTGDEIISDILLDFHEAQEIMTSHGIACAGCHINQYETLREGVVAHYNQKTFERVLADLNEAAQESGDIGLQRKKEPVFSDLAHTKILEFQENSNQKGWGLKVDAMDNLGEVEYFLDFQQKPDRGDRIFTSQGINIFCSPESERFLRGKCINYVIQNEDEGFKFENQ